MRQKFVVSKKTGRLISVAEAEKERDATSKSAKLKLKRKGKEIQALMESKCVTVVEKGFRQKNREFGWGVSHDPSKSRQVLESLHRAGGTVEYRIGEWGEAEGQFDLIYCNNGLRGSIKSYWKKTLQSFHAQLAPGGVLAVISLNALEIKDEVRQLTKEAGYDLIQFDYCFNDAEPLPIERRSTSKRYYWDAWITG